MLIRIVFLMLSAFFVGNANASTVFSDNFDSNALALNSVPTGWSVSSGTVDVIGNPAFHDFIPGNGRYIDLDGSTGNAGILSHTLSLTAGVTYLASFQLAGSHRGSSETVVVNFGATSGSYTLPSTAGFTTYSLMFTPSSTGTYTLSFDNNSNDNVGALLDNVNVSSVPVPAAIWLFGSALIGLIGFKRKTA